MHTYIYIQLDQLNSTLNYWKLKTIFTQQNEGKKTKKGVGASQCKRKHTKRKKRKRRMQDLDLELHLSDMAEIDLKAWIRFLSGLEPRACHLPREPDKSSVEPPAAGLAITVDRPPSVKRGLRGPPTRTGSWSEDSLAKVRHSEVSSTEWASKTRPHSEQMVSPAEWSNTTSVSRLQSAQYESAIGRTEETRK